MDKLSRRKFIKLAGSFSIGLPAVLSVLESCSGIDTGFPVSSPERAPNSLKKPPIPTWCLWSVRREDLQDVYCAGFDGVRPAYGTSDNYWTAQEYASIAESIGFKKLIYDCGLKYFYITQWNNTQGHPDLQAIKAEIDNHFGEMSGFSELLCYPYIDEPDDFGKNAQYGVPGSNGEDPIIDFQVVDEFNDLVNYAQGVAAGLGSHLIIATTTPDIVHCCNPFTQNCSNIDVNCRNDWPSYYYNFSAQKLMSSLYDTANNMSQILPAISSNYPGKSISQIINFFDTIYGCRNACTVQQIKDQINVNAAYTSEHWFYQGDYISINHTVNGVNSLTQWQNLLQAIQSFGVPNRGPCI